MDMSDLRPSPDLLALGLRLDFSSAEGGVAGSGRLSMLLCRGEA